MRMMQVKQSKQKLGILPHPQEFYIFVRVEFEQSECALQKEVTTRS